jgi:hypothetical protein
MRRIREKPIPQEDGLEKIYIFRIYIKLLHFQWTIQALKLLPFCLTINFFSITDLWNVLTKVYILIHNKRQTFSYKFINSSQRTASALLYLLILSITVLKRMKFIHIGQRCSVNVAPVYVAPVCNRPYGKPK